MFCAFDTMYVSVTSKIVHEQGNLILAANNPMTRMKFDYGILLEPNELTTPVFKMVAEKLPNRDYYILVALESFQLSILYCLSVSLTSTLWGTLKLNVSLFSNEPCQLMGCVKVDQSHLLIYGKNYVKLYRFSQDSHEKIQEQ